MLGGPSGAILGFTIGASTGLAGVALIDILDHEFVDSISGDFAPDVLPSSSRLPKQRPMRLTRSLQRIVERTTASHLGHKNRASVSIADLEPFYGSSRNRLNAVRGLWLERQPVGLRDRV
jgi:hypothetical protein